ncbi:MAG TPA: hypothetical protein VHG93_22380 [Longimicrobium sp.]|nr:hypothetical protein [Longimicrobium sp.]
MDGQLAGALLFGFSGYSPALPPIINSAILTLYLGVRDPDRARAGPDRELLEQNCEVSLEYLHRFFENDPHERARQVVQSAMERGSPFGLYLRSFAFGARAGQPESAIEEIDGIADAEVITTTMRMKDDSLQRAIVEHLAALVPVVAVTNPALELRRQGGLPRLALGDDWQEVVEKLVRNAAVILLYLDDEPSAGVATEMELIRQAGRQASTIVLVADPAATACPPDFTRVVPRREEDIATLRAAVAGVLARHAPRAPERFSLPAPPGPPAALAEHCDAIINMGLLAAGEQVRTGSALAATDDLMAVIAMSFWAGNAAARAVAFAKLAVLQHQQGRVRYAVANLERALDLLERLAPVAETPAGLIGELSGLRAELERQRHVARAEALLDRLRALEAHAQPSPPAAGARKARP